MHADADLELVAGLPARRRASRSPPASGWGLRRRPGGEPRRVRRGEGRGRGRLHEWQLRRRAHRLGVIARAHIVVGTTGFDVDEGVARSSGRCRRRPQLRDRRRPDAAVRSRGARYPPAAEIVELHHDGKADAPSGRRPRRRTRSRPPVRVLGRPILESIPGGLRRASGIRIHSIRPWSRRAPGGHLRWSGTDAHDPWRLHGPDVVRARC